MNVCQCCKEYATNWIKCSALIGLPKECLLISCLCLPPSGCFPWIISEIVFIRYMYKTKSVVLVKSLVFVAFLSDVERRR